MIAHLSFEDVDVEQLIGLCDFNPNSIIIIDRDRDDGKQKLKPNAERIKKEFYNKQRFAWITGGREIENYIHPKVLKKAVRKAHPKSADFIIGSKQFDRMVEFKSDHKFKKTLTAREVVKIYNEKSSYKYDLWDLDKQLNKLINGIKKAGNMTI